MATIYVGIDLGTSNSTLATYDGTTLQVVANSNGEPLTPSVVRIDARGDVSVGRRARRFLESDPANTRAEFKRLMGSAEQLLFAASGRALLPEELSAHVLTSLLGDARDILGFPARAAVISTPALFEVPQNHATSRAGALAGLEETVLIQEPVASAIAAGWRSDASGLWLVFDLGGGTLDVSLLETREGFLRVVGHTGDNFLGGRDFDNAILDWALGRIAEEHGAVGLERSNPAARLSLVQLKAACEQAKIDLSRAARARIEVSALVVPGKEQPIDVDLPLDRATFERLVESLVLRSLTICTDLLSREGRAPAAVERVVLVGGPTLMPALRQRVGEAFGGRLVEGVDPMTVVARGAALYAATAGLDARPPEASPRRTGLAIQLEHPTVTSDLEPFVVGRFLDTGDGARPEAVWVERLDGGFRTEPAAVSAEGSFVAQIRLAPHQENRFRLLARGRRRELELEIRDPEFSVIHGVTVADPPLSRTLGVARADDRVHVYFEKGTPLPARRTFVHQAVLGLQPGSTESVLRVPVVQGEFHRAHRNRLIGALQVRGIDITRAVALGARVEVTLTLDRSGRLHARADLPETGESVDDVVRVLMPAATSESLQDELGKTEDRLADLRRRTARGEIAALARDLDRISFTLLDARKGLEAAKGGDVDAAHRSLRLLLELNGEMDTLEESLHWPELEAEAHRTIHSGLSWVTAWGSPTEQQMFQEAMAAAQEGLRAGSSAQVDRQIEVMRVLARTAFSRDPQSPSLSLEWYRSRLSDATDVKRASELVQRGRELVQRGAVDELREVNRQLDSLFPGTADERRRSFCSGLR